MTTIMHRNGAPWDASQPVKRRVRLSLQELAAMSLANLAEMGLSVAVVLPDGTPWNPDAPVYLPVTLPASAAMAMSDDDLAEFDLVRVHPEPPPAPTPEEELAARRERMEASQGPFMRAAARMKIVTYAEAEAYLETAAIPAAMMRVIDALPEAVRLEAQLEIKAAVMFRRSNPLFAIMAAAGVATDAQLDELFDLAAAIAAGKA